MEVGSPEWIEASLAKLDELESERAEHEAALESANDAASLKRHNDALERLDAEIKGLYAQLESFAGDDEEDEDEEEVEEPAPVPVVATRPVAHAPAAAPVSVAAPAAAPMTASASAPSSFDAPAHVSPSISDDDDRPAGGGAKWMFVGLVVIAGLGVGGFFAWKNMEAEKAKQQAKPTQGEEVKIQAASIPEDTEAPNAAKGGDATISPTANGQPSGSSGGGGGGGGGGGTKPADGKKKKPLELKGGTDPLGGNSDPL